MKNWKQLPFVTIIIIFDIVVTFIACDGSNDNTAHTHSFGNWTTKTEATCTMAKVERKTCSCGEEETRTVVSSLGHNWSAWEETLTPTELKAGELKRYCGNNTTHTEITIVSELSAFYGTWFAENFFDSNYMTYYDSTLVITNNALKKDDSDGEYFYFNINSWVAIVNDFTPINSNFPSGYILNGNISEKSIAYESIDVNLNTMYVYLHTNGRILTDPSGFNVPLEGSVYAKQ
jgi:hypothetical protein